jgi:AraC family transcriptional regulator
LGKIAAKLLASGDGWEAGDVVCTAGPHDRPYEEQHIGWSIAVVIRGSFKYHSKCGETLMSPGALLLGNCGEYFECSHEHATGDRCLAFHYTPEFFDRCGVRAFRVLRIPPLPQLTPWAAMARLAVQSPERVNFDELAWGLANAVGTVFDHGRNGDRAPRPADERRISATLRFIESHYSEPMRLRQLAAAAGMSDFHFLRTFRQVTGLTPHQYLLRTRLREAALRLVTQPEKVLEIALSSGFDDLSNFNHAFRAEFGVNPRAYRRAPASQSPGS